MFQKKTETLISIDKDRWSIFRYQLEQNLLEVEMILVGFNFVVDVIRIALAIKIAME